MNTEERAEAVKAEIAKILGPLPTESRREVFRLLNEKLRQDERKASSLKSRVQAMEDLKLWTESGRPLKLERNDCSRLHKLKEACRSSGIIFGDNNDSADKRELLESLGHTFVVRHDWAAAFADAEGVSDDFRLPYDLCCFEFRINGRTIIARAIDKEESSGKRFTAFVEMGELWYALGDSLENRGNELIQFMWGQITAICIALDAEVATKTIVRAPHKLNEKRIKAGNIPLADYSVVDLARRQRVANPVGSAGAGSKKRLHFRRGHWRHFDQSKTWVRWCLVGDPDLGFIAKQYSL